MHIPVLYVKVPSKPTKRSFMHAILKAFGENARKWATADDIEDRLDRLIVMCRVQLLLIDEFQHLVDSATRNVQGEAAEFLKEFTDRHRISFVIFGLPHCTAVFEGEAHGQLRDRIGKAVELGPLDRKEGQALLAELDDAQPFPNVGLAHGQYAENMLLATQFYPGRIASIVAGAVERGCWRGKGRLDEGDFWWGFERWIQVAQSDDEFLRPKENPWPRPRDDKPLPPNQVVARVKSLMRAAV